MVPYIAELNMFVALGTIALQGVIVLILLNHFVYKSAYVSDLIARYALHAVFGLSFIAMLMSLFYSEVIGFLPCDLCWFGRIFMYPLVFISGVGLYLRDVRAALYAIPLAIAGVVVSLYHYYIERGGASLYTCSSEAAGGVSCARSYLFEFGYVTFSMMSLTLFILFIVILTLYYRRERAVREV